MKIYNMRMLSFYERIKYFVFTQSFLYYPFPHPFLMNNFTGLSNNIYSCIKTYCFP